MSFIPILLLIFFLLKSNDKENGILNILKDIDISSLSPVLEMLGVKNDILNLISSEPFKNFLEGKGDLKSLLPLALPLLKNLNTKSTFSSEENMYTNTEINEYFNPIKDIAGEQITSTLGNYFST